MKIKKDETYGEFIKRIRQTLKLTQAELGLKLGFHANTISAWERGRNVPMFTQRVIDNFVAKK